MVCHRLSGGVRAVNVKSINVSVARFKALVERGSMGGC